MEPVRQSDFDGTSKFANSADLVQNANDFRQVLQAVSGIDFGNGLIVKGQWFHTRCDQFEVKFNVGCWEIVDIEKAIPFGTVATAKFNFHNFTLRSE